MANMNVAETASPLPSIVWPLALAQTIAWATYFYAFPAFLLIWEQDLGWTKATLSGAYTLALFSSAGLAPFVGRLIDRGFAVQLFGGGMAFAALLLVALSQVTAIWHFYLIWFGLGIAMASTLYEACFALLTQSLGKASKRGITIVALVAGFAGTVSFPSAHFLSLWLSWRSALLIFAGVVAGLALPLALFACRQAASQPANRASPPSLTLTDAAYVMKLGSFWWLALLFAAIAINHGMIIAHLLAILDARGIAGNWAVTAASMIGPMQVLGRFLMVMFEHQASTTRLVFLLCMVATLLAALSLMLVGVSLIFLISFVVFQGAGYGVTSIIRPVFVAERLGRRDFGTVTGFLAVAFVGGSAIAPSLAALVWTWGGYDPVIWLAISMSVVGVLAVIAVSRTGSNRENP